MRNKCVLVMMGLMCFVSVPSAVFAQAGIYWPAKVLEEKQLTVGTDLLLGSTPTFAWIAHARYGVTDRVDISPKIGFSRDSGVTAFALGGDLRYGVMQESAGDDVDLLVAGAFTLWTGGHTTSVTIGAGPLFGKTFAMQGSDMVLSPYAGILIGAGHVSANNQGKTDFGGILPIGNQLQFRDDLAAHFELDVLFGSSTELQVGLGIDYLY